MAEIMGTRLIDNAAYRRSLARLDAFPYWDALAGKTLLISGASGMVGSFLTDAVMLRAAELRTRVLALGRNETAARERFPLWFGREEFAFLAHDVSEPLGALPAAPELIVHAASNTHPAAYASEPVGTILTNVLGTRNLLDVASAGPGRRFLLLSSVEIYGENRGGAERFSERDCGYLDCNTLRAGYPEAKRVSEALCQAYIAEKGADAVILRLPRCYGPGLRMSDTKAASQFLKKAAAGQDVVLKSAGEQRYSFAHVCDAAQGILFALLRGRAGEAYNLADPGSDLTLRALAEQAARCAGTGVVFALPDDRERRGYSAATRALLDAGKLRDLGWRPQYDIETGVRETVEILRETESRFTARGV